MAWGRAAGVMLALAAGVAVIAMAAGSASGERTQHGNLILSLDGGLSPLALPRDHPAPVSVKLDAGLRTTDGRVLPRVTKIELGIPGQGRISTKGLPVCTRRKLRDATTRKALATCSQALVGRGKMLAQVRLPNQKPFAVHATLLAFNGRVHGRRAVIVHAVSARPPTSVVLPFLIRLRSGRFGTVLVAHLPSSLGPWPRFARFSMSFSRRYRSGGHQRSYLSASCPIPKQFTAGFFSFARAMFTLADGRRLTTGIARSCRARN